MLIGLVETRDGKMHVLYLLVSPYFLFPCQATSARSGLVVLVTSAHDHHLFITQAIELSHFGAYTHHHHHIPITQAHLTGTYCRKDHGDQRVHRPCLLHVAPV